MPFLSGVSGALVLKRKKPQRLDQHGKEIRGDAWDKAASRRKKKESMDQWNTSCTILLLVGLKFLIASLVIYLVGNVEKKVIIILTAIGAFLLTIRLSYSVYCCINNKEKKRKPNQDTTIQNNDVEAAPEINPVDTKLKITKTESESLFIKPLDKTRDVTAPLKPIINHVHVSDERRPSSTPQSTRMSIHSHEVLLSPSGLTPQGN